MGLFQIADVLVTPLIKKDIAIWLKLPRLALLSSILMSRVDAYSSKF